MSPADADRTSESRSPANGRHVTVPTAHAVQVNADPDHYTKWFPDAEVVVAELAS